MNVFATDHDPAVAARSLDDKRGIKMILETTQLLSNARISAGLYSPYKQTHVKHPCSVWASALQENYEWLWQHGMALSKLYTEIYGKIHACHEVLLLFTPLTIKLPRGELYFVNCAANSGYDLSFKHINDPTLAYRMYLSSRWLISMEEGKTLRWSKRFPPSWFQRLDAI